MGEPQEARTPFWKAHCHQLSRLATVPTSTVTSLTALSLPQPLPLPQSLSLPCPVLRCPATAQPGFKRPWTQELGQTRAACTQEYIYFLPCAPPSAKTSPTTARRQPAQQTFLRSFSFPFNKTVLPTDRLSKSLAQILAPLSTKSQPLAAHLTPAPQGQLSPRGCRLGPGHSGHSLPPPPRALTDLRQTQLHEAESPGCAPPERVHGVGAAEKASEWGRRGRALGGGQRSTGRAGRPNLSEAGVRLAMRAPRKLGAVFIPGLRE